MRSAFPSARRFRPIRPPVSRPPFLHPAKPADHTRAGPDVYPRGPYPDVQEAKGRAEHMMWVVEREDGGRGAGFTGGHNHVNWKNDGFRKVVLNALVWLVKLEVPAAGGQEARFKP